MTPATRARLQEMIEKIRDWQEDETTGYSHVTNLLAELRWSLEDLAACLAAEGEEEPRYGSEVLCETCAVVFCPHGERGHFFHDGCPQCDANDLPMKMKSANCSIGEHGHCSGIFKTADEDNLDKTWTCQCSCHTKGHQPPVAAQTNEPLVTVRWEDLKDVMCLLVEYVDCPDVWSDTIGRFEQALGMTHAQLKARS